MDPEASVNFFSKILAANDLLRFEPATNTWIDFYGITSGIITPPIWANRLATVGQNIYSFGGINDPGIL